MQDSKFFGAMLDMSRNAVMSVDKVKEYASYLAKMGYNGLMLYTEDTLEVNNEPYFGYLRGRYTKSEIKELDAYCAGLGIELVPCVQTLAHLNCIFKWREYGVINDVNDILLVEEERTYELIRNIFDTAKECFTSRRINIGMDEAHLVGLGKFLDKHGYKNRFDIIRCHLEKVLQIAKEYDYEPMMWSDMFFRLVNKDGVYHSRDFVATEQVKNAVPSGVDLVCWDYYYQVQEDYEIMFDNHREIQKGESWFAGGAWTWMGFAPMNRYSLKTMRPAMRACRNKNIQNVFITVWGDNGSECSYFSVLPSLFHIKCLYDGIEDLYYIKKKFFELTGEDYDNMLCLDLPNMICGNDGDFYTPCKYMLYNDLFCGFLDANIPEGGEKDYAEFAKIIKKAGNGSKFKYVFDSLSALCDLLSIKYPLGIELRSAYKAGDKKKLKECSNKMAVLVKKVNAFYNKFRDLWFTENKPQGFDVQDARLGGLMQRIKACKLRLDGYLNGKVKEIPELAEELLPFDKNRKNEKYLLQYNNWQRIFTVNVV